MLQTHGGEIRWRNIFVREIGEDEAKSILTGSTGKTRALSDAITLHASFDRSLDADFSRGDRTSYVRKRNELHRSAANGDAELVPDAGRFGGALHFPAKGGFRPTFKDSGVLGYNGENWNAAVSVWLRLNPDKDLFRYAIRPLFDLWNPTNVSWADIPFEKRPMVQVQRPPFSREQ